jgi:hypothetical protein
MQVYARKKGAEISTIDFSLLPVLDPTDGRVLYLVAEGRDIHEKKKIEAEIVRKNSELQKLYDRIKVINAIILLPDIRISSTHIRNFKQICSPL